MKIEVGKHYRTRSGKKVDVTEYRGAVEGYFVASNGWHYKPNGECAYLGQTHPNDDRDDRKIISEWSEPMDLTDYNDGKWHGWNGGECPVDPESMVDVHYINAFGGYGRDENRLAGQHSWALPCLFRVTKPAPPKPREWWIVEWADGNTQLTESKQDAEDSARSLERNGWHNVRVIHVREVLPE